MKKLTEATNIPDYRKEVIKIQVEKLGMAKFLEQAKRPTSAEIRYAACCAGHDDEIWHGIGYHIKDLLDADVDIDILSYAVNLALNGYMCQCQQIISDCVRLSQRGIKPKTLARAVNIASSLNCDSAEVIRHCRELVSLGIKPSAIKRAAEYIIKANEYVDCLIDEREQLLEIGLSEKFLAKIVSAVTKGYYPRAWLKILENSPWFIEHGTSLNLLTRVAKTAIKNNCTDYVIMLVTKLDKVGIDHEVFQLAVTTALADNNSYRRCAHDINTGILEIIKHSRALVRFGVNRADIIRAVARIRLADELRFFRDETYIDCLREIVKHREILLQIGVPSNDITSAINFIAENDPDGASYILRHKSEIRKTISKSRSDIEKEMRRKLGINDSYEENAVETLARSRR